MKNDILFLIIIVITSTFLFFIYKKKQTPTLEVGDGMIYFPYQTSK